MILAFGTNIGYDYLYYVRELAFSCFSFPLFVHFSFSQIQLCKYLFLFSGSETESISQKRNASIFEKGNHHCLCITVNAFQYNIMSFLTEFMISYIWHKRSSFVAVRFGQGLFAQACLIW